MKKVLTVLVVLLFTQAFFSPMVEAASTVENKGSAKANDPMERGLLTLGIEECIDIALKNNRRRPASKFAIEIAEAQHRQTFAAYLPQLVANATYTEMNRDPNFVFPAETSGYMARTPLVPFDVATEADIGEKTIKVADRRNTLVNFDLMYPLYTGGMRGAITKQAEAGLKAAKEASRRTDLEIVYDVHRMYYGAVLARNLYRIASDALARLEVTLELTENLYKKGSGRVKKTDYLRGKIIVEALRSATAVLKSSKDIAKAALANTMGLEWGAEVEPLAEEIPFEPYESDLNALVCDTYEFNPDWASLKAGLEAAEAKIKEEESGFQPKVAFTGTLNYWFNPYKYGMATKRNKETWTIGFAVQLPVFDGFLTANKVREAKMRLKKLEAEKILLKEGLALQIKHIFLQMSGAREQSESSKEAARAAEENRELNVRAYQDELVETKDVIEAQLLESFMKSQYNKALYDHAEAQAHLNFAVGREMSRLLEESIKD